MLNRRKLITHWTAPVVLSIVLPPHAQASSGGLRWVFELTVLEGTSTISLGDSTTTEPLLSPFTRTLSFRLTTAEITAGSFTRERGNLAADYERFDVSITAASATQLSGTFEYISADFPFSLIGNGVFTATCP